MSNTTDAHDPSARYAGTSPRFAQGGRRHDHRSSQTSSKRKALNMLLTWET